MRIGIISDTHNQLDRTQRAVELLQSQGAEALIHCGDLATPDILAACAVLPLYFVFGNHDADMVPALQNAAKQHGAVCLGWGGVVELGGKRVGVVHGHLTTDLQKVFDAKPDYLLTGHSHLTTDFREGSVRRVNPGALDRSENYSVAMLDLETDTLQFFPLLR